jgi:hypothetical protein
VFRNYDQRVRQLVRHVQHSQFAHLVNKTSRLLNAIVNDKPTLRATGAWTVPLHSPKLGMDLFEQRFSDDLDRVIIDFKFMVGINVENPFQPSNINC